MSVRPNSANCFLQENTRKRSTEIWMAAKMRKDCDKNASAAQRPRSHLMLYSGKLLVELLDLCFRKHDYQRKQNQ